MDRCIVSNRDFKSIILTFNCLLFSVRTEWYKCRKEKNWTKDEISTTVFMLGFYWQIIKVCPAFNQWSRLVSFWWNFIYSVMKTHKVMVNVRPGEITCGILEVPINSSSHIQKEKLMFMMKNGLNTYKTKTE